MNNPETPSKALMSSQLATHWSADSGKKLSDTQAMDLIAREMSGQEWDADTLDVIAAYVRGTGREILDSDDDVVEVWTLTIDPRVGEKITTTVHASEAEANQCLIDNYDPQGIYDGDVAQLIDSECLVVHIESHQLVLGEADPNHPGGLPAFLAGRDRAS